MVVRGEGEGEGGRIRRGNAMVLINNAARPLHSPGRRCCSAGRLPSCWGQGRHNTVPYCSAISWYSSRQLVLCRCQKSKRIAVVLRQVAALCCVGSCSNSRAISAVQGHSARCWVTWCECGRRLARASGEQDACVRADGRHANARMNAPCCRFSSALQHVCCSFELLQQPSQAVPLSSRQQQ